MLNMLLLVIKAFTSGQTRWTHPNTLLYLPVSLLVFPATLRHAFVVSHSYSLLGELLHWSILFLATVLKNLYLFDYMIITVIVVDKYFIMDSINYIITIAEMKLNSSFILISNWLHFRLYKTISYC